MRFFLIKNFSKENCFKKTHGIFSFYKIISGEDFDVNFDVSYNDREEIDKWLLSKYNKLLKECTIGYDKYLSGKGGMPHFKKKGVKVSYTTNCIRSSYKSKSYANIMVDIKNRTIVLPKLGSVKIRGYRNLKSFSFKIINATVSRVVNKYYVSVVVQEDI